MKKLLLPWIITCIAGCGGGDTQTDDNQNDNTADTQFDSAVIDIGDSNVMKMLEEGNFERLKRSFSERGLPYVVKEPITIRTRGLNSKSLSGLFSTDECVRKYPFADKSKFHTYVYRNEDDKIMNTISIYINAAGLPSKFFQLIGPFNLGGEYQVFEADTACQTSVRRWGKTKGGAGTYMIPLSMGGYPGRANLIPMNKVFAGQSWSLIGDRLLNCYQTGFTLKYTAQASYVINKDTIRPHRIRIEGNITGINSDDEKINVSFASAFPNPPPNNVARDQLLTTLSACH